MARRAVLDRTSGTNHPILLRALHAVSALLRVKSGRGMSDTVDLRRVDGSIGCQIGL